MIDPDTAIRIADALEQIAATTYTDPVMFADEWEVLLPPSAVLPQDMDGTLDMLWSEWMNRVNDPSLWLPTTVCKAYAYYLRAQALLAQQEARRVPVVIGQCVTVDYRYCFNCKAPVGSMHKQGCYAERCDICGLPLRNGIPDREGHPIICRCPEAEALALLRRVAQEGEDHGNA